VLNHTEGMRHVTLPHSMKQLLEGAEVSTIELPAYGVSVLLHTQ
jgi:hypothetical protein